MRSAALGWVAIRSVLNKAQRKRPGEALAKKRNKKGIDPAVVAVLQDEQPGCLKNAMPEGLEHGRTIAVASVAFAKEKGW